MAGVGKKPGLAALSRDWGATDAERRHRASLITELRALGIMAELAVLGRSTFDHKALGQWAGVFASPVNMDKPDSMVAQTAAMRALLTARPLAFLWGLDGVGNQAARVGQALDRTQSRIVTAGADGEGGGLMGRLRAKLASSPNLIVVRTGAAPARDGLQLAPGVDPLQLRRHTPDTLVRMERRKGRLPAGRHVLSAFAETAAGRARVVAIDGALRARGLEPVWAWFGLDPAPDALESIDATGEEVAGDLPLLIASGAAVAPDHTPLSRLFWREAAALGRPTLAPPITSDLSADIKLAALPESDADAADWLVVNANDATVQPDPAFRHARDHWSVAGEAKRLAGVLRAEG